MSSGVRELRVWQESVALAADVIRAARQSMRRETKLVSEAPMATSMAVATLVAEGYGRVTPSEQREAYQSARRSVLRLETELAILKQADLLPAGAFGELTTRGAQLSKLLGGYLAYLDRQIDDAARGPLRPAPTAGAAGAAATPGSATPGSARAPS
jgi:four helix bundle protein